MDGCRRSVVWSITIGAALLASAAQAKTWAKWAPAPLASDSSYAALSARASDSLTASELMWLTVQRDWRAQRDEEARPSADRRSISSPATRFEHVRRRTDARFAALASRPYEALTDSERAWLVAENSSQKEGRAGSDSSKLVGGMLLGALVGAVAATLVVASAWSHANWPL